MASVTIEVEDEFDALVVENFYSALQRCRSLKKTSKTWREDASRAQKERANIALVNYNDERWSLLRWVERRLDDDLS